MAFNCPTVPPTAAFYNDFLGFPSKYNTIFNKESTFVPPTVAGPTPFSTVPSTFGAFPWSNTWSGSFPWANNWTGSFPSTWTGFPSTWAPNSFPANWTGAFPWANNWTGSFPSTWTGFPSTWAPNSFPANWTGSFPSSFGPFGGNNWNNFNNNTLCATTFRPSSEAEYFTLKNPIRFFEDGTRGLWLCFDLRGYKPEEVCVTINKAERCIVVEATHDVKEYNVSRKFYRKFVLPEYLNKVDITKIEFKSFFGPDGMFYVEGILPRVSAEECSAWPAYPYVFSNWTNPAWCWANNSWTNNSTWAARPWNYNNWCNWTNWTQNSWNAKPIACKLI